MIIWKREQQPFKIVYSSQGDTMLSKELQTRILAELEQLPLAAQGRVLEFVQSLANAAPGPALSGSRLADMFGLIDEDDPDMHEAIEDIYCLSTAER